MSDWTEQVKSAARILHAELAQAELHAEKYGFDVEILTSKIYEKIENLYSQDYPLAQARDNSDLLLRLEGDEVQYDPRLSTVVGIFNNVKGQVRDLTKALAGLSDERRVTARDIELSLSGLAKGSLYVGFAIPLPGKMSKQDSMLDHTDKIYQASKGALKTINQVAHFVSNEGDHFDDVEEISSVIDDPKVRDTALIAIQRLSPSGRGGYDRMSVSGLADFDLPASLTPDSRRQLRKVLADPVVGEENVSFEGVVREIDLDARRFELRRLRNREIQDIRCVFAELDPLFGQKILNSRVRVTGLVERRRSDDIPRLMKVERIEDV